MTRTDGSPHAEHASVRLERQDSIAVLTLDRPEAGNRLNRATLEALRDHLTALHQEPGRPSVVVLQASGPDFCLGREPAQGEPPTPARIEAEFQLVQLVNDLVQHHPAVTLAAIRGRAYGAGLSLAGRCDLVVAAQDARLSFPEVSHSIPPTIVLSHYRYVLPPKILADLIFTGRELSGQEALAAGLVSHVFDAAKVEQQAMRLATEIAAQDARTLSVVKRFLVASQGLDPRDAPALGIAMFANEMADRAAGGDVTT